MKRVLAVHGLDGELKVSCRKCGGAMTLEDQGERLSIPGGNLGQEDLGWVWVCECGHTEDE